MVDGGPSAVTSGIAAPRACQGEFYVDDYTSRMRLAEVPLQALSRKTTSHLSQLLNGIKILPSEEGYLRDWRGLAHCAKVKSELVAFLSDRADPTRELLEHWAKQQNACKLSDLQTFLGQIDRWDVIDDTNESFLADAEEYLELLQKSQLGDKQADLLNGEKDSVISDHEEKILTEDDVKLAQRGLPPQQYHAFVLYADEDVEFATELIERMESAGLKLCEKSRDLLGGTMSHDAILRLIRERCNRLIVIVSPAFLQSRANTFFMTYAQALGIEQRRRKIVPCIYKKCILPPQLNFYFSLHYENRGKLFNFWDKLKQSIQSPDNYSSAVSTVGVVSPKVKITEIDSVNHVEVVKEQGPQMFPPPAKLRNGSSMFDLRAIEADAQSTSTTSSVKSKKTTSSIFSRFRKDKDKEKSKSFWDLSSLQVDPNPTPVTSPVNPTVEPLSPTFPATSKKQKWYQKIITPKTQKVAPVGDSTPTSPRSMDKELYLGPDVPSHPLEEAEVKTTERKKKKLKLLAW